MEDLASSGVISARIVEEGRRLRADAKSSLPIVEFLRIHAGGDSTIYNAVKHTSSDPTDPDWLGEAKRGLEDWLLLAERDLVGDKAGLLGARFEAATDLMEQVQRLLDDGQMHPAAPVMLAGAALEQSLRGLVESRELQVKGKPGIGAYSDALRAAEVITRQDKKNIDSWGGLRNSAAHGQFDQLSPDVARVMAMGVNLFLQLQSNT